MLGHGINGDFEVSVAARTLGNVGRITKRTMYSKSMLRRKNKANVSGKRLFIAYLMGTMVI